MFVYMGSGPAFYQSSSGVLPELSEDIEFRLLSWSGASLYDEANISLDSGYLKIEKQVSDNRRGMYQFGGLQSPADPNDPLMMEFVVRADPATLAGDPDGWSGVFAGFKINDTGMVVKFLVGAQAVGLYSAAVSDVSPTVVQIYDWADDTEHTYKILWWPQHDLVRVYVSSGSDLVADTILLSSTVSAFPGPLASNEIPANQPTAFFGHGSFYGRATSLWKEVSFHNIVTSPVQAGIYQGEHTGFIRTNNIVEYYPEVVPTEYGRPWNVLPSSFGDIEGSAQVTVEKELEIYRTSVDKSYGFFRYEPELALPIAVLDFQASGELHERLPVTAGATGMLDEGGIQSIGILTGALPAEGSSYVAIQTAWSEMRPYRVVFDQNGDVVVMQIVTSEEGGVVEQTLINIPYLSLPASDLPGPGIGFIHNANTVDALATMKIGHIRYSMRVEAEDCDPTPTAPWTEIVSGGAATADNGILNLDHTTDGSVSYYKAVSGLDPENGFLVEFRTRINSYEVDGELDPIRKATPVTAWVDDGTNSIVLMFADAGPQIGKIIAIATKASVQESLDEIRSGNAEGTYVVVDWTEYHAYRLEKVVGESFRLVIDHSDSPALDLDFNEFEFPNSVLSFAQTMGFGSATYANAERSDSDWDYFRYNLSTGFDVAAQPVLSENEVLSRFNHSINVIAHAEETL
jgi:hypothetical protein